MRDEPEINWKTYILYVVSLFVPREPPGFCSVKVAPHTVVQFQQLGNEWHCVWCTFGEELCKVRNNHKKILESCSYLYLSSLIP